MLDTLLFISETVDSLCAACTVPARRHLKQHTIMPRCTAWQRTAELLTAPAHSAMPAGCDEDGGSRNTAYSLFQVQLTLTTEGRAAGPGFGLAPVGLLFEYLQLLRREGPQAWVWQESKRISDSRFRCAGCAFPVARWHVT